MNAFGVLHLFFIHFPVALVLTAFLLEVRSWRRDRTIPSRHSFPLLAIAGVAALAAAATGWLHASDGPWATGASAVTLERHRWIGIAAAVAISGTALLLRGEPRGRRLAAARAGLILSTALVAVGGHLGSELTHGHDAYLDAWRRLVGGDTESARVEARLRWAEDALAAWSPPASGSPTYARHIQPILVGRCLGCHGPERKRGGLRLDSLARVREEGDLGPALVPGYRASSGMYVRVVEDSEDHPRMPKDEPPLPPEWIEAIGAWIDAGAAWPTPEPTPWLERDR